MLLVGSPGSGKGTLSSLLSRTFPTLTTISAGDLLRSHISRRTPLGIEAESVVSSGSLMPDETMMRMVGSAVRELGAGNWLLDGFPRTSGQARLLDAALEEQGKALNLVVNLDVPESVILARILDRWVHPASGRVYNLSYNPPKRAGMDDETGEPLVQRSDDNEATFRSRLEAFKGQTGPMIRHFAEMSKRFGAREELGDQERAYVSLRGETSKEIWPKLKAVMRERYAQEALR
ncbi:ADK-domain-containing protein [Jaminaea rosea]|uniref:ADK-domain-containing protein n=1 Tax=Jaminaea rosea TaxID=1569628 RepID=A0A316V6S4_9BASI|nr:ADK-domain-containing protein [Jaminaea rosea]PWN31155.1 ADK-domain-containing protein [Jaminaea rosea]